MGCDIHAHIEVKVAGRWLHYSCPNIKRWYQLFERICGVRGNVENAIAPPRGLPNDISEVTKICRELEDGHSETWLSAKELDDLINWAEEFDEFFQHEQIGYLNGNMFLYKEDVWEDVRLVCWFDN